MPIIELRINGQARHALLDTGSNVNVMFDGSYDETVFGKKLVAGTMNVHTARGQGDMAATLTGPMSIDITSRSRRKHLGSTRMLIMPGRASLYDMILGQPFLQATDTSISPSLITIRAGDTTLPIERAANNRPDDREPSIRVFATAGSIEGTSTDDPTILFDNLSPAAERRLIRRSARKGLVMLALLHFDPGGDNPSAPATETNQSELSRVAKLVQKHTTLNAEQAMTRAHAIVKGVASALATDRALLTTALARHACNIVDDMPPLPPARPSFDAQIHFLDSTRQIKTATYRLAERERAVLARKLIELINKGYLVPGSTKYAVPMLLVRKPGKPGTSDADYRLVQDWRMANQAAAIMPNTLRPCAEAFGRLAKARIFSRLDLKSGFDCLRTSPDFQRTIGVLANQQIFQFTTLPQGFLNSSTIFQHFMNAVFTGNLATTSHAAVLCRINAERASNGMPPLNVGIDLHDHIISYIDDILLMSQDSAEHAALLQLLLARLEDNHLFIHAHKIEVGTPTTTFLGFSVGRGQMSVPPERITALQAYPMPRTKQQLATFLGKINYLRLFIANYPLRTQLLQDALLRARSTKGNAIALTPTEQDQFQALKETLTTLPVLNLPDPSKLYYLSTDASDLAMGAVLWQRRDDGRLGPVGYFSRRFTDPERRSQLKQQQAIPHCNELESLAALCAMKHFDMYLRATTSPFVLLTDSAFLYRLTTSVDISAKHRRWLQAFEDYNFITYHLAGSENSVADLLSRPPTDNDMPEAHVQAIITRAMRRTTEATNTPAGTHTGDPASTNTDAMNTTDDVHSSAEANTSALPALPIGADTNAANQPTSVLPSPHGDTARQPLPTLPNHIRSHVTAEYASDKYFKEVLHCLSADANSQLAQHHFRRRFKLLDQLIYLNSDDQPRICIPEGEGRRMILNEMHRERAYNHPGVKAQLRQLRNRFYWPEMTATVTQHINNCPQCAMNKPGSKDLASYYQPSAPFPQTMFDIHIDLITNLPDAEHLGTPVNAILTMVDRFSRFTLLEPITINATGNDIVNVLQRRIVNHFGIIRYIYSDRDVRLQTKFKDTVLKLWGTTLRLTTAGHPQANGLCERTNGLAIAFLRNYCSVHKSDWPSLLADAETAINNHHNDTIGMTPFFCVYGFNYRTQLAVTLTRPDPTITPTAAAQALHGVRLEALMSILDRQEALAAKMNNSRTITTFKMGQWVKVRSTIIRDPESRLADNGITKLAARWSGPFQITEVTGPGVYRLALPPKYRAHPVINIEHLAPFHGDPTGPGFALDDDGNTMDDMFIVHDIIDHKCVNGQYQFFTRWAGYFYPRDGGWYTKDCFVSRDHINTIFTAYVAQHNLPKHLLSVNGGTPDTNGSAAANADAPAAEPKRRPGRPRRAEAVVNPIAGQPPTGTPADPPPTGIDLPFLPRSRARRAGRPRRDQPEPEPQLDPLDVHRNELGVLLQREIMDLLTAS